MELRCRIAQETDHPAIGLRTTSGESRIFPYSHKSLSGSVAEPTRDSGHARTTLYQSQYVADPSIHILS